MLILGKADQVREILTIDGGRVTYIQRRGPHPIRISRAAKVGEVRRVVTKMFCAWAIREIDKLPEASSMTPA
jgi:hypothetical protein